MRLWVSRQFRLNTLSCLARTSCVALSDFSLSLRVFPVFRSLGFKPISVFRDKSRPPPLTVTRFLSCASYALRFSPLCQLPASRLSCSLLLPRSSKLFSNTKSFLHPYIATGLYQLPFCASAALPSLAFDSSGGTSTVCPSCCLAPLYGPARYPHALLTAMLPACSSRVAH